MNTFAVRVTRSATVKPAKIWLAEKVLQIQRKATREEFHEWLDAIEKRKLVLDGHELLFPGDSTSGGLSYYCTFVRDSPGSYLGDHSDRPALVLKVTDNTSGLFPHDEFDRIEVNMRVNDPPFDGLRDLRENLLGNLVDHYQERSLEISFTVPMEARLERLQVSPAGADVEVRVQPGVPLHELRLGTIGVTKGETVRKAFPAIAWTQQPAGLMRVKVASETPFSSFKAILARQDIECGRLEFDEAPPIPATTRSRALTLLRPEWPKKLSLDEMRGREFEHLVADLLVVLGFSPMFSSGTHDAPDIVAFPPGSGYCLVIECSGSSRDAGSKLAKLLNRTSTVEQLLQLKVQPIFVTAQALSSMSRTDTERAAKDGISIITRERLTSILATFEEGVSVNDILAEIEELVPPDSTTLLGQTVSIRRSRIRRSPYYL